MATETLMSECGSLGVKIRKEQSSYVAQLIYFDKQNGDVVLQTKCYSSLTKLTAWANKKLGSSYSVKLIKATA